MNWAVLRRRDVIDETFRVVETDGFNGSIVEDLNSHQQYIIRALNCFNGFGSDDNQQLYEQNLDILSQLDNPSIPKILWNNENGILFRDGVERSIMYYLTDIYSLLSLHYLMPKAYSGIPVSITKAYFLQLASGLAQAHSKGISYRCIGGEDLRFTPTGKMIWACQYLPSNKFKDTGYYMHNRAPEISDYDQENIGIHADIYYLGNTLRGMCFWDRDFGDSSFSDSSSYGLLMRNEIEEFYEDINNNIEVPEDLKQLLTLMMQPDPTLRPSLAEVLKHHWVQYDIATDEEIAEFYDFLQNKTGSLSQPQAKVLQNYTLFPSNS